MGRRVTSSTTGGISGHRSWQEQCMMGEGDEGKTREQLVDEARAFRAQTAALPPQGRPRRSLAWNRSVS